MRRNKHLEEPNIILIKLLLKVVVQYI
jgi:hypothetical protein